MHDQPIRMSRRADADAVALVNRLLTVEDRVLALQAETAALRRHRGGTLMAEADAAGARTRHEWKLAEDASAADGLWLFDIRVDDAVILASREAQAFFTQFGLLEDQPDIAGAVSLINTILAAPAGDPDVSVVIPVYGQLVYTLNCLHGLARHASRQRLEIILVDDASPDESGAVLPLLTGMTYHRNAANAGFVASCNTGAKLARGRYVVLLNNDTRVVAGWLDALIDHFAAFPRTGLVGSKLHYADGSLQEAGGIIWRDGTAQNYGRGDDPNRPDYSYARQVDYISGCSIALPVSLWRELGGFDPWFGPAYCEDVDLAFRVRAAGYQVWFQPQSRIVHYEGKTSGFDISTGTKAYQVSNMKKLFLRWRDVLAGHRRRPDSLYLERERNVNRRFLVVDVTAPTPDQDAGSVQTFLALQVVSALGYKAHFVPEDNWLFQPKYTTALQLLGVDCAYAPYELDFESYMERYGWMFDVVMVYRPGVMEKCLPIIRAQAPQAAVLFHLADLHYLRLERTAALHDDSDMHDAAALMKTRELSLISEVDCTITHSGVERDILAREVPEAKVAVWPLMSAFHGTGRGFDQRRDICFLGGYGHPPNIDAVLWFLRDIFPLITAELPQLRFIVAGAHPPEEITALASDQVIVTGKVPDLRDLFDPCRVFVCPLRVGAGVKGKIVSALSYGIPIVATSIGVEGTGLIHDTNILVADQPADFAAATLRLYRDAELWARFSLGGQRIVQQELSVERGQAMLTAAIDTAFAHKLELDR
jgi:GT2 family glycosyltransferase/glycosyltransferase involved in cell wall biosynthesis